MGAIDNSLILFCIKITEDTKNVIWMGESYTQIASTWLIAKS